MIVSHKYRFIFIKTRKTAGSSMETALAPLCGPDDIVTPLDSSSPDHVPRNYYEDSFIGRAYARSRLFRKCIDRHSPLVGRWFYEHMPGTRVRELVGDEVWNSYYKFCFERNSWDKVVSYYHWKIHGQHKKLPPFEDYVVKKSHRLPRCARLYFDGEQCIVDDVFDFSDFKTSFQQVCDRLSIPFDGNWPREKTGIAKSKPHYRDFYSDTTREKVASMYSREIKLMGYTF